MILSCSLLGGLRAADQEALSIDYSSKQLPLDTVLDHLERFAQLETSIDSKLLTNGIHKVPITIHLVQADRDACLQAICHALNAQVWWYADEHRIHLTHTISGPPTGKIISTFYQSNVQDSEVIEPIIRKSLGPWLDAPKSGLGLLPQQRTWSASLNQQGHEKLKRLLSIFEQERSNIPACINPALKRVLAITEPIEVENWADAANGIAKQLKCSVSMSSALTEVKEPISIRACDADEIINVLAGHGVTANWNNQVLCIGKQHVQTWQHPVHVESIWIPLAAYKQEEQIRLVQQFKNTHPDNYWDQAGCTIQHMHRSDACFVSAHPSVLAVILNKWQQIDRTSKRP